MPQVNPATQEKLLAPFPYFGGKSKIAHLVWEALGDCRHYIEPFFGSGAVLLLRPNYRPGYHIETVNDADGYVANVWRALQFAPDEVARWCDWPVNHADLTARRKVLIANEARLLENLANDDTWYDAKLAGCWIWAASCWIGSGLTSSTARPHVSRTGCGVHKLGLQVGDRRPHVSVQGMGVHKLSLQGDRRPSLADGGRGVHKLSLRVGDKRPHLNVQGTGVHKISMWYTDYPDGLHVTDPYNPNIYTWFRRLSERLRYVRVVCGDWTRVCGGNWQDAMGTVGIFMDPPYPQRERNKDIYYKDSDAIWQQVNAWCLERGKLPSYRIVIAGYDEHQNLLEHGWRCIRWKAHGGYTHTRRNPDHNNPNRFRETLYFSPYCLEVKSQQQNGALFE